MGFRDQFRKSREAEGTKVAALLALKQADILQKCMNIAFSYQGLIKLVGETQVTAFTDMDFCKDLSGCTSLFGDPSPDTWKVGGPNTKLDLVIQIAGDSTDLVAQMRTAVLGTFATPPGGGGILINVYEESGFRDPSLPGHEHFGFLDGIGQPAIRGVYNDSTGQKTYFSPRTISATDQTSNDYSFPGINLVWPGEFVFGYTTPDPLNPTSPFSGGKDPFPNSSPFWGNFPTWAKGGSLLGFRRLQQDVPMFWNFIKDQAANTSLFPGGISDDELGSRLVGRWPSGAPIMRSLDADNPEMGDQSLSNSNFFYAANKPSTPLIAYDNKPDAWPPAIGDLQGRVCPFSGHIRKVQPRDAFDVDPMLHRIIRRGSPYGQYIQDRYTPDAVDRGLLFISYQASIQQGLAFIQQTWANSATNPKLGGHDFIIGQPTANNGERYINMYSSATNPIVLNTTERWVIPTGGGFFFVPPIDFFASTSPVFSTQPANESSQ